VKRDSDPFIKIRRNRRDGKCHCRRAEIRCFHQIDKLVTFPGISAENKAVRRGGKKNASIQQTDTKF
jgi:hypothetical protein